ncbi:hypothetical protein BGY98DRAFT_1179286 [Russula aff. rugulosa BPL654]|nr:hypothetical protein BGY98DRAFT_1179286 [Russula aff. rugulosa BPL654]
MTNKVKLKILEVLREDEDEVPNVPFLTWNLVDIAFDTYSYSASEHSWYRENLYGQISPSLHIHRTRNTRARERLALDDCQSLISVHHKRRGINLNALAHRRTGRFKEPSMLREQIATESSVPVPGAFFNQEDSSTRATSSTAKAFCVGEHVSQETATPRRADVVKSQKWFAMLPAEEQLLVASLVQSNSITSSALAVTLRDNAADQQRFGNYFGLPADAVSNGVGDADETIVGAIGVHVEDLV